MSSCSHQRHSGLLASGPHTPAVLHRGAISAGLDGSSTACMSATASQSCARSGLLQSKLTSLQDWVPVVALAAGAHSPSACSGGEFRGGGGCLRPCMTARHAPARCAHHMNRSESPVQALVVCQRPAHACDPLNTRHRHMPPSCGQNSVWQPTTAHQGTGSFPMAASVCDGDGTAGVLTAMACILTHRHRGGQGGHYWPC